MSSSYERKWRRVLRRIAPFLFKKCPEGNWHWRWDHFCWCRVNHFSKEWHGGVLHFATGQELHPDAVVPGMYWSNENLQVGMLFAAIFGLLIGVALGKAGW